jgi:hypothetical protein
MNIYDIKKMLEGRDSITFTASEADDIKKSIKNLLNTKIIKNAISKDNALTRHFNGIIFSEENGIITAKVTKVTKTGV